MVNPCATTRNRIIDCICTCAARRSGIVSGLRSPPSRAAPSRGGLRAKLHAATLQGHTAHGSRTKSVSRAHCIWLTYQTCAKAQPVPRLCTRRSAVTLAQAQGTAYGTYTQAHMHNFSLFRPAHRLPVPSCFWLRQAAHMDTHVSVSDKPHIWTGIVQNRKVLWRHKRRRRRVKKGGTRCALRKDGERRAAHPRTVCCHASAASSLCKLFPPTGNDGLCGFRFANRCRRLVAVNEAVEADAECSYGHNATYARQPAAGRQSAPRTPHRSSWP